MDAIDKRLLTLLSADARASVVTLAKELKVSRSTVYERMKRLEDSGIITGYTIRESDAFAKNQITAHVMLTINAKHGAGVTQALKRIPEIRSLYTVSGIYDLAALVRTQTTHELDKILDTIGTIEGIEKTTSSIVLSTKFER